MPEATTTTTTTPPASSTGTQGTTPPPQDWRMGITDESLRNQQVFSTIKADNENGALNELAKQLYNAQKMIGADKVLRPQASWTPEQVSQWRKDVLHTPDSADKYEVDLSSYKDVANDTLTKQMKDIAFKSGMSPDQATNFMKEYFSLVQTSKAAQKAAEAEDLKKWDTELNQKWGADATKNKEVLDYFVRNQASDELRKVFEEDPDILKHPVLAQHFLEFANAMRDDSTRTFMKGQPTGTKPLGDVSAMTSTVEVFDKVHQLEASESYKKVMAAGGLDNLRRNLLMQNKVADFAAVEADFKKILEEKTRAFERIALLREAKK